MVNCQLLLLVELESLVSSSPLSSLDLDLAQLDGGDSIYPTCAIPPAPLKF